MQGWAADGTQLVHIKACTYQSDSSNKYMHTR